MRIYQSFLGDDQRAHVSPIAIPYDVSGNTRPDQREYELFKAIFAETGSESEPWGVVSWKFQYKSLVSLEEFATFAGRMFERGCDCVFINPMIGNEATFINVWEQGHIAHDNMEKVAEFLKRITVAPVWAPMGRRSFAFCNYFVATRKFWRNYFSFVDYVLDRLRAEVDQGTEVGAIYAGTSHYARDRSLTMRPFIIERLFSSFIAIESPLSVIDFRHTIETYHGKFGERLGTVLHELSALKNRGIERNDKADLAQWHERRARVLGTEETRRLVFQLDDPHSILLSPQYHAVLRAEAGPSRSLQGHLR